MGKCITHATQPYETLPETFQRPSALRLSCHISNFKFAQFDNFPSVFADVRQLPECLMRIQELLPFALDKWKQCCHLCRPYFLV